MACIVDALISFSSVRAVLYAGCSSLCDCIGLILFHVCVLVSTHIELSTNVLANKQERG